MADLSDDEIIDMAVDHNLGRTMFPIGMRTGDVFVTDTAYRTDELLNCVRAAIAADRALNAAHSVGAEGLPPLPEPAREVVYNGSKGYTFEAYTVHQMRAYALAALASRPAVDADKRDAERYRFLRDDFSPMGLNIDGNHAWAYRRNATLKGPTLDAAIDAARHPAQRENT